MDATILNNSKLERYRSFDFAWLGPIVYPLGLSLCSLCFASYFLLTYPASTESKSVPRRRQVALIEILIVTLIVVEWIFSICCFVQCIVNFSSREYVGGASACEAQSVYVTFYLWSALLLTGSILIVASQYERQCLHMVNAMPSIGAGAVIVTVILALALCLGLLPFAGVGNFFFAVDYCQPHIERSGHGLAFVVSFFIVLVASAASIGLLFSTAATRALVASEGVQDAAKVEAPRKDSTDRDLSDSVSAPEVSEKEIAICADSDVVQETANPLTPTLERCSFFSRLITPGRSMYMYAFLLMFYVSMFMSTVAIYVAASTLEDGELVANSSMQPLYGVQAFFIHQGQVFHPLLYGWLLRARMYRVKIPFSK